MKIIATLLALTLVTPITAATITLPSGQTTWHITGDYTDGFRLSLTVAPLPEPDPTRQQWWEYSVDFMKLPFDSGYAQGACFSNFFICHADPGNIGGPTLFHVGDFFRVHPFWGGDPVDRPNFLLSTPDGVTLTQTPLPAGWLLFASMLGLGGLFRRWRSGSCI